MDRQRDRHKYLKGANPSVIKPEEETENEKASKSRWKSFYLSHKV